VVLAASGFPLSVIFGQIPAIWSDATQLNHREAMGAAVIDSKSKIGGNLLIFPNYNRY
jgi:hypothetical protein